VADVNPAATGHSYRRALITYIDVLGFRELIEKSRKDPGQVGHIADLLGIAKNHLSSGGRIHRDDAGRPVRIFYSFSFSDLIVRCTEIPHDANIGDFVNWELLYISDKQWELARNGVLLRGGMCIGNIYVDSNFVFGPGLVKAYELEANYAVFPRIIIDRDLLHKFEKEPGTLFWHDYITRGEDGAYFADYLFGAFLGDLGFGEGVDPWVMLEAHRDQIQKAICTGRASWAERVKQKYMWLALYHNSTVRRLRERMSSSSANLARLDQCFISDSLLMF
jgi:hypothetical protein